jgi:hypothetical protein
MHLVYIDDSGDSEVYGYSALCIPVVNFRRILGQVKAFRKRLNASDGMFINKEFHAVDFCSGRGHLGKRVVTKWRRAEIFRETLQEITTFPGVSLLNAFGRRDEKLRTLERLVNRINTCMSAKKSIAILMFDQGEERAYTRLVRKMGVYNPIPSRVGAWEDGSPFKNVPIEYVIEDPHFKRSKQSYFIQMADFCGYAMLQKERPPTSEKRLRLRLHEAFSVLDPICVKAANRKDPYGIIR